MKVFVLCFAFLAIANAQETTSDDEGNERFEEIPGGYVHVSENGNSIVQSSQVSSSSSSGPTYNSVSSVSQWKVGPDGKRTGGTVISTNDGSKQNTIQFGDDPPKVTNFEEIPKFEMPAMPKFEIPQIPTFNFFPFPGFPAHWAPFRPVQPFQFPNVPFRPVHQFQFPNMNFNFPKPNGNGNFVGVQSSSVVSNVNGKVSGQTTTTQNLNGDSKTDTVQFGN